MDRPSHERARGVLRGYSNSADLGDLPLSAGGYTAAHQVIRTNVPTESTGDLIHSAREHNVVTVLDLRSHDEARLNPHPLAQLDGYRLLPVIDPAAEASRDPAAEPTIGHIYSASLSRNAAPISDVFAALSEAPAAQ